MVKKAAKKTSGSVPPEATKSPKPKAKKTTTPTSTTPTPTTPTPTTPTPTTTTPTTPTTINILNTGSIRKFSAKIRPEDRTAPQLFLSNETAKIKEQLTEDFQSPSSRKSAYIHGPLGSFSSDIFLDRALINLKKEKLRNDGEHSNIVIFTHKKTGAERLARRLVRMQDPQVRTDLENRIEILDSFTEFGHQAPASPRVIFIPMDSLISSFGNNQQKQKQKQKQKNTIENLQKYINIDNLRYFYFEQAHMMSSDFGKQIFEAFTEKMHESTEAEIIGTNFCNKYYTDGTNDSDIRDRLQKKYYLASPEAQSQITMPCVATTEISSIESSAVNSNDFEQALGKDDTWIEQNLVKFIAEKTEEYKKENRPNPRIIITARHIATTQKLRDLLMVAGYKVGLTNSEDGNLVYQENQEEKKYEDRLALIDDFGKEYNILIHCGSLDGEEIPADLTLVYKVPNTSENLEYYSASARTPFQEEESNPREFLARPRSIWLIDRAANENYRVEEMLGLINSRHQENDSGIAITARRKLDGLTPQEVSELAKLGDTASSVLLYGGNPLWLNYLEDVLKNYEPGKKIDEKLKVLSQAVFELIKDEKGLAKVDQATINKILRGAPTGLSHENIRKILDWCFTSANVELECKNLVSQFPFITGISSADEVKSLIDSLELGSEDNAWQKFLYSSYGSKDEFNKLLADFLFRQNDASIFYQKEKLTHVVNVLVRNQISTDADKELDQKFLEFLLTNPVTAQKFSIVRANEIRPDKFKLPDHVSIRSVPADLAYLNSNNFLDKNPKWVDLLKKALGYQNESMLIKYLAEHILRNNPYNFASKDVLVSAASCLLGSPRHRNPEMIKSLVRYINEGQIPPRIDPKEVNSVFPDTYIIEQTDEDRVQLIVNALNQIESKIGTAKIDFLRRLNQKPEQIFFNFIKKLIEDKQKEIFKDDESIKSFLRDLFNPHTDRVKQNLSSQFIDYLINSYPETFDIIDAEKTFRQIINLNQLAQDPQKAQKIILFSLNKIQGNRKWAKALEEYLGVASGALLENLAPLIHQFMPENNLKIEDVLKLNQVFLGAVTSPNEEQKNKFREFISFLETRKSKTFDQNTLQSIFPAYYSYAETISTPEGLAKRIKEKLDNSSAGYNQKFLDKIKQAALDSTPELYLAKFIQAKQIPILSAQDLENILKTLLKVPVTNSGTSSSFIKLIAHMKTALPDLTNAEINSYFKPVEPLAVIDDINRDDQNSIKRSIGFILDVKSSSAFMASIINLVRPTYTNFLDLISEFLHAKWTDLDITDDKRLKDILKILIGENKSSEKAKNVFNMLIGFLQTKGINVQQKDFYPQVFSFSDISKSEEGLAQAIKSKLLDSKSYNEKLYQKIQTAASAQNQSVELYLARFILAQKITISTEDELETLLRSLVLTPQKESKTASEFISLVAKIKQDLPDTLNAEINSYFKHNSILAVLEDINLQDIESIKKSLTFILDDDFINSGNTKWVARLRALAQTQNKSILDLFSEFVHKHHDKLDLSTKGLTKVLRILVGTHDFLKGNIQDLFREFTTFLDKDTGNAKFKLRANNIFDLRLFNADEVIEIIKRRFFTSKEEGKLEQDYQDEYPLGIKELKELQEEFDFENLESIFRICGSLRLEDTQKDEFNKAMRDIFNDYLRIKLSDEDHYSFSDSFATIWDNSFKRIQEKYNIYQLNKKIYPNFTKGPLKRDFITKIQTNSPRTFFIKILETLEQNENNQKINIEILLSMYETDYSNEWKKYYIETEHGSSNVKIGDTYVLDGTYNINSQN
jgi:hypothetical protein